MTTKKKKSPKLATETSPDKPQKKVNKRVKNPNHVHESKGQSKALRYLKLWYANKKDSEQQWKFEKCRQIWLLQNCYDGTKVPKADFKILLM